MRSPRHLLIAAGVLIAVGLALVLLDTGSYTGYSMGNVTDGGDAYSSELSIAFDGAWLVSTQALIGWGLTWVGSLLVAGVVGHRIAARPARR